MEIRTDADIAGGRCFTEAFRQDRDTGRSLFRAACKYWTFEVSGGGLPAAALASQPRDFGLMRDGDF